MTGKFYAYVPAGLSVRTTMEMVEKKTHRNFRLADVSAIKQMADERKGIFRIYCAQFFFYFF